MGKGPSLGTAGSAQKPSFSCTHALRPTVLPCSYGYDQEVLRLLLGAIFPKLWCGCNVGAGGLPEELALSHGQGILFDVGRWILFFFCPTVKHR